jgi:type VI secretion system protein ImpE
MFLKFRIDKNIYWKATMSIPAIDLFNEGKLQEAIDVSIQRVREKPGDIETRNLLSQFFCFQGDWARADKQLETIAKQDTESMVAVSILRQLIRAENARKQFFLEGRVPEIVSDPTEVIRQHLRAAVAFREQDWPTANEAITLAKEIHQSVSGTNQGQPFDDLFDLDDLLGPVLEVLTTNGKYYWVPIENIRSLQFRPPKLPRDLLWRSAAIEVTQGPQGEVFLPAIYYGSHLAKNDAVRIGQQTEWSDDEGRPVRGLGGKMIVVGEQAVSLMELEQLEFN